MQEIGKLLIGVGLVIVMLGVVLVLANRLTWLGRLPGDISFQTDTISCFFPIATSIVLSIIATIVLNLLFRLFNK
jgi:hypothetical protein